MKPLLRCLLLVSVLSLWGCDEKNPVGPQPPQPENFQVKAYFSKHALGQMTDMEQHLIHAINVARSSVMLDMPRLESYNLVYALREAKLRGLHVELCLDAASPSEPLRSLREAEVTIRNRRTSSNAGFQHRFAIIDNQQVWTGSHLATPGANSEQDHNAVMVKSQLLASQFATAFRRIYGSGEPFGTIPRGDGAELAVRFTPFDDAEAFVVDELSKATTEIRLMSVELVSTAVAQALIQQAEKGVSIEGVLEGHGVTAPESQYPALLEKGIDLKRDGNAAEMAHQVFIIDGKTVLTGSRAFQGGKGNLQHVLALRNQTGIAQAYLEEYKRVRALSR